MKMYASGLSKWLNLTINYSLHKIPVIRRKWWWALLNLNIHTSYFSPYATCGFRHGRTTTISIWGPFWGPFLVLWALLDVVQRSFSSGMRTLLRRPSVQLSVCKHFLLSHLLQYHWSDFFETLSECSPQCLVVQVPKRIPVHSQPWLPSAIFDFFLLSHLLRHCLTDSNETCLLCSPQCLVVQVQKTIRSVDRFDRLVPGSDLSEISNWQACYRISSKTTGRMFLDLGQNVPLNV